MNKKGLTVVILLSCIISLISGMLFGIFFNNNSIIDFSNTAFNIGGKDVVKDSINDGVNSTIDGVVVIESYLNDQLVSTGTGFIYKINHSRAYIMTNNHVISGSSAVRITLNSGDVLNGVVIGGDSYSDIAVIGIDSSKVNSIVSIGNSEDVRVGDTVFTIGNPEGASFSNTVTKGILSGKDRYVNMSSDSGDDFYIKVLQTDAAINPGNSGGVICNISGDVIGVTNMKLVDSSVEGMGFAIPIEDALFYASSIEKGIVNNKPYLGITVASIHDSFNLWKNNITVSKDITNGIVITSIADGSPASKAGLKVGDVIVKINDIDVISFEQFKYNLYKFNSKDKINLSYYRDNKLNNTVVKLGSI